MRTTEASLIVMSQSSYKSNTNCQICIDMNCEFFLKKSRFLEIFTFVKSYESPQNEPRMLRPPALDSDSLDDKSDINIGSTIDFSLDKYTLFYYEFVLEDYWKSLISILSIEQISP